VPRQRRLPLHSCPTSPIHSTTMSRPP
jgi:hypothetical protein